MVFIGPPPDSGTLLTWRGEGNLKLDGADLAMVNAFVVETPRLAGAVAVALALCFEPVGRAPRHCD